MAFGADFQVPTSVFMGKVNGTGCLASGMGSQGTDVSYLPASFQWLHFSGVMQDVDGGQLLHCDPLSKVTPRNCLCSSPVGVALECSYC